MADFLSETIETKGSGTTSTTKRKSFSAVNLVKYSSGMREIERFTDKRKKKEKILAILP